MNKSPIISIVAASLEKKKGLRKYVGPKRIILAVFTFCLAYLIWGLYRDGLLSPEVILEQKKLHPLRAVILFIAFYVISIVFLLPSLPLNLAAGFFWGGILGGILTSIGMTLGSLFSFYIARTSLGKILAE